LLQTKTMVKHENISNIDCSRIPSFIDLSISCTSHISEKIAVVIVVVP